MNDVMEQIQAASVSCEETKVDRVTGACEGASVKITTAWVWLCAAAVVLPQ